MTNETDRRTWPLEFGERAELRITSDVVPVVLAPVALGEAPYLEAVGKDAGRITVEIGREGTAVRVTLSLERRFLFGLRFDELRVVAHVPRELTAWAHADAGSINVHDLGRCTLELSTNAGQIKLDNVQGNLRLRTDAGQIKGRHLGGSFEVRTSAGQVQLGITRIEPGEHHVRTDVGAVKVDLAPGLDVRVETRASLGSARSSYPSRPNAAALLRVATDVGAVRVGEGLDENGHDRPDPRGEASEVHIPVRSATTPATAPPPPPVPPMPGREGWAASAGGRAADAEIERILKMVEAGELSPRDADDLLRALNHE